MSEDKVYKDGDIVWVKLGNSWWPGEVIGDEKRLPDDVHQFKKQPYCVVKFFQEDAYEYPKNAKQVHPFQCPKKEEFIKKGLALFNAKKAFMEKFPDDVKHAEKLTKPTTTSTTTTTTTRIINDRPGGLVKEMWGHGLPRRSTDYYENRHMTANSNGSAGSHNYSTSRRDSVTTILNITPNRASMSGPTLSSPSKSATSARTLSTSSSASVTPNTTSSSQYRCNYCDFATTRQNVLIMHRKAHSSSGTSVIKPLSAPMQSSITSFNSSSMQGDALKATTKPVAENVLTNTSTPLTTKRLDKSKTVDVVEKKTVEPAATELTSSTRSRKKASASPSPKVLTTKRTLRNSRAASQLASASPTIESANATVETENIEAVASTSKIIADITPVDDDATANKLQQSGTVSPTDSKNSEQIRQRLLADWSDEEKEENHEDGTPTTSRKSKSSNTLELPSTNVSSTIKRRSPTIVPMKTLEGAGQTLVVAASTQSTIVQEIIARTTQRIRNIPKKDRLRDFANISNLDMQPKISESVAVATAVVATSIGKTTSASDDSRVSETDAVSGSTSAPNATLSCFDFQEDEEEPENDVLKSIANYKKKYFSPDKDKACQQSSATNEHTQAKQSCAAEQRDKELSAEIDTLLEQTTAVTQTFKEDTIGSPSVKGLPIKERGKRIFKSRNRARNDDDDGQPVETANKAVDVLDSSTAGVEEIKQENIVPAAISPAISERRTRGTSKRTRGKTDSKDQNETPSPVNGNNEKNQTPESASAELPSVIDTVQSAGGMVFVSQSSRRKPYNHRIMRQVIEEEETSIPFIRHSPVEIYSCDSSLDNGMHVIRGRRSKTTTPNSLTAGRDETINGGGSRASSRSMNAAPLTPTDDTSSLGVSDAGAEFGSPASSLDEERLLTPVHDMDNQHANEFEPINDSHNYDDILIESNDEVEEDEEIESPPHEALSGNELDDHELKEGNKRLKTPKKKLQQQQQQQQEEEEETNTTIATNKTVGKRKSRAGTESPAGTGLPKRLTRGALQEQSKDLSVEAPQSETHTPTPPPTRARSTRGSPANVELKQKATESRSTPTRASSRHAATTKTVTDLVTTTSMSPSGEVKLVEHALDTHSAVVDSIATEEKVPSPNRATTESPAEKSDASRDSMKRTTQQRMLRLRSSRSRTPATEIEVENPSTDAELDSKSTEKSPNTSTNEDMTVAQAAVESPAIVCEKLRGKLETNKTLPLGSQEIDDIDVSAPECDLSTAIVSTDDDTALLAVEQIEDEKKAEIIEDTSSNQNTIIDKSATKRKRRTLSNEATTGLSPNEKASRTHSPAGSIEKNPRIDSPHSLDLPSSPAKEQPRTDSPQNSAKSPLPDLSPSSAKKHSRTGSPQSSDNNSSNSESLSSPDKKLSRTSSPRNSDKISSLLNSLLCSDKIIPKDTFPHSPTKKQIRADSPHSPLKEHSPAKIPHSPDKKLSRTERPNSSDKKVCRTESPHSSDKKLSCTDPSLTSAKKYSRWDSPHSSDKKTLWVEATQSSDKKSSAADLLSSEKKVSRWDSPHSSDKKPAHSESPQTSAKKCSRWDSPSHAGKTINLDDPSTVSDESVTKSEAGHSIQKEATDKDSLAKKDEVDTKSESRNSPNATEVDEKGNVTATDLDSSQSTKQSTSTTDESIVENVNTPATTSSASFITSPTVEKVRINVDVANPLSTQIANILAASGNSIASQKKSPKSNTSPSLKRKRSFEEAGVVDTTAADGDAVVAHVQSLCPQVKITRKERIISPTVESVVSSPKKAAGGNYEISQMPIVLSNEQVSAPKKSPKSSVSSASGLSFSNLWQTDLLQPPTTSTTLVAASDNQAELLHEPHSQKYAGTSSSAEQAKVSSSPTPSTSSDGGNHTALSGRLSHSSRSSQSPSPQKSPAAATGGRKQAGNTVTLPSSITVKPPQHKFAEALALADSVLGPSTKPTKRRSSQTTPTSLANTGTANSNRRLNSAPALDVRSTPPAKIPKISADAEESKPSPIKAQPDSSPTGKSWSQSHRQAAKQKKTDSPSEVAVESAEETTTLPVTPPSPTKIESTEESDSVTDVEQINSTAKITAVPIQPIPGYAEPFLLCMLVDNMYKPINNIPHYLNTDLNQLVPVPPEAYKGMLPELAVDQPPASSTESETATESSTLSGNTSDQQPQQMNALHLDKSQALLAARGLGESTIYSDNGATDEAGFKLVLQSGESALVDSAVSVDQDVQDGAGDSSNDNAIVLNLENQQIILDSATFEQLLANPDANTQLVTDDGTEFVLTREVLAALKAQHDGQNVELLAIPAEQQQLQEQLMASGGISEAGSSADLLSVALANSEFYGNDVLQIETTLGAGAGAAGLQLLASDGSIVFQAPPLPQAHLTPPITAHTSETNAVLNQTPIMSTLEKPSTAGVGGKGRIESPIAAAVAAVECDVPGMRPNLDDSLAVIGVTTQSSTVPTSLELPITITNPAIAPKVTMAQSVATTGNVVHIFEDSIDGIN